MDGRPAAARSAPTATAAGAGDSRRAEAARDDAASRLAAQSPSDAGPSSYSRDRAITLSDGVFAIAITLLVLELVPDIAGSVTGSELAGELAGMAPKLAAYLLSFLVIGRFWDTHRGLFRFIQVADSRVVWANLAVLLWITLFPATCALLGSHPGEPAALTLYAANLLLAIGSLWVLSRRGGLPARAAQYVDRFAAVALLGFGLAIPAAFVSPPVAFGLVFLTATFARTAANRTLAAPASPADGPTRGQPEQAASPADDER